MKAHCPEICADIPVNRLTAFMRDKRESGAVLSLCLMELLARNTSLKKLKDENRRCGRTRKLENKQDVVITNQTAMYRCHSETMAASNSVERAHGMPFIILIRLSILRL